ncbi:MAG: GIY-YIG nuclease family protein [Candidatus Margulisbacteria bacterium]|jgi:predicted transport protein|nr:GIY-YIG nuclease family protein [Candidatus Margulisiibacteriota bacterium]
MQTKNQQVLYILTNPCLAGWIKIGIAGDLEQRLRSLNNKTAVPLSYKVYATLSIDNNRLKIAEQIVHSYFDRYRARELNEQGKPVRSREFFSIAPEEAYHYFEEIRKFAKLGKSTLEKHKKSKIDDEMEKIAEEAREVSEAHHTGGDINYANENIKNLYMQIKNRIFEFGNGRMRITEEPQRQYIAFKVNNKNFTDIKIHRKSLVLFFNIKSGQLPDKQGLARDLEINGHIGHHGNGDYDLRITDGKNLEYIVELIKFSLERNSK